MGEWRREGGKQGLHRVREVKIAEAERVCWCMWNPSGFANEHFCKLGSCVPWTLGDRGPIFGCQLKQFFGQPGVFSDRHVQGDQGHLGMWHWDVRNYVNVLFKSLQARMRPRWEGAWRSLAGIWSKRDLLSLATPSCVKNSNLLDWWLLKKEVEVFDQLLGIVLRTQMVFCVKGAQKWLARAWSWRKSWSVYGQNYHEKNPKEKFFLFNVALKENTEFFQCNIEHGNHWTRSPLKKKSSYGIYREFPMF